MWPWEHLAVAYVAVSLLFRARGSRVGAPTAVVLAVGSQFPDLVDKPLAWSFGVLPSGTTLAHSVFVATPACLLVWAIGRRHGHAGPALAFAVAYALHLPGDILYGPLTSGGLLSLDPLLWPLVAKAETGAPAGLLGETLSYVRQFGAFLSRPEAAGYLFLEVCLLGSATALWFADGCPGVGTLRRGRARIWGH